MPPNQRKSLDGAVDHPSFIVPPKTSRAIAIRTPAESSAKRRSVVASGGSGNSGTKPKNGIIPHHHKTSSGVTNETTARSHNLTGVSQAQTNNENSKKDHPIDAGAPDLLLHATPNGSIRPHPEASNHDPAPVWVPKPSDRVSTLDAASNASKELPLRSNLDIYAHKYVPYWLKAVNESTAAPVYGQTLQRIDFDTYRSSFAYSKFLPPLPLTGLPPVQPCQIATSTLDLHTFERYWKERLHNEYAAQHAQNMSFGLFNSPVGQHDPNLYLYRIKVPGLREYAPKIDLGDILLLRPLQPVLQGLIAQQALRWSQKRDTIAPGFCGMEHHAVVWSIKRREEIVIVKLGQPLHGPPGGLRCNLIIPLQIHKNALAWRAIELTANALMDQSNGQWLRSKLFPNSDDGTRQTRLSKGTFDLNLFDKSLNYEQQRAVQAVVDNNYGIVPYLISGPPGTGKTKTLVEAAMQLVSAQTEHRVTPHLLLCAPSDAAADTLLERLSTHLKPTHLFRLNNWARLPTEVPGEVQPYCYLDETQHLYSLPDFEKLMSFQIVVTSCRDANMLLAAGLSNSSLATMTSRLLGAISPSSSAHPAPIHWTALLLDEAAQATEPEALIPMMVMQPLENPGDKSPIPQVVMAGDEYQLGPRLACTTVCSSTLDTQLLAPAPELGVSLFQRLFERPLYATHPLSRRSGCRRLTRGMLPIIRPPFTNLIQNYRSHPAILTTCSQLFYTDTLTAVRRDASPSILSWPRWPSRHQSTWPVMFVQNTSDDAVESVTEGDGTGAGSLMNRKEAQLALETVEDLLSHVNERSSRTHGDALREEDVIVMSPYRAQVNHLRSVFRGAKLYYVRIGPLEAFQGLESRIVVLCTTRTRLGRHPILPRKFVEEDKLRGLGVIDEEKRFNVAMTRAKEGLIVFGSAEVLTCTRDRCWTSFLAFAKRNGLVDGNIPTFLGQENGNRGGGQVVGALERGLRYLEDSGQAGLDQVEGRNMAQMNGSIVALTNGENSKFRLLGRKADLDETMWNTTHGYEEGDIQTLDQGDADGDGVAEHVDEHDDDDNDDDNNDDHDHGDDDIGDDGNGGDGTGGDGTGGDGTGGDGTGGDGTGGDGTDDVGTDDVGTDDVDNDDDDGIDHEPKEVYDANWFNAISQMGRK